MGLVNLTLVTDMRIARGTCFQEAIDALTLSSTYQQFCCWWSFSSKKVNWFLMTFFTISPQYPSVILPISPLNYLLMLSKISMSLLNAHVLFSRRVKNFDIKVDTGGGDYRMV